MFYIFFQSFSARYYQSLNYTVILGTSDSYNKLRSTESFRGSFARAIVFINYYFYSSTKCRFLEIITRPFLKLFLFIYDWLWFKSGALICWIAFMSGTQLSCFMLPKEICWKVPLLFHSIDIFMGKKNQADIYSLIGP